MIAAIELKLGGWFRGWLREALRSGSDQDSNDRDTDHADGDFTVRAEPERTTIHPLTPRGWQRTDSSWSCSTSENRVSA
jgi:hypothetical protein